MITFQLKIYAGKQEAFKFIQDKQAIGYALPHTSVSQEIPPTRSDAIIYFYCTTLSLMYFVSAISFFVWYDSGDVKEREKSLGIPNTELLAGMTITAIIALIVECLTRCVYTIFWSKRISNASGRLVAVWWPQMNIFFMATFVNLLGHAYISYKRCTHLNLKVTDIWKIHSSKVHAIVAIASTAFGLVYTGFPAIVLIFVYPAQMIAILAFILSFLFATTVFAAILFKYLMKLLNDDKISCCECYLMKIRQHKTTSFLMTFSLFSLITIYIHSIIVVILYSLIIGRGSVITTGPIFFISLLLPALLSGVSFLANKYWLKNDSGTKPTDSTSCIIIEHKHRALEGTMACCMEPEDTNCTESEHTERDDPEDTQLVLSNI